MKKVVLAIALIAVLIGGTFGGLAMAADGGNGDGNKGPEQPQGLLWLLLPVYEGVGAIEGKLDDPDSGLAEIKAEVDAIEIKLDDPSTGLAEIKAEISAIEVALANVPRMETLWGHDELYTEDPIPYTVVVEETYPEVRHIHLTVGYDEMEDFSKVGLAHIRCYNPDAFCVGGHDMLEQGYYTWEFDASSWSMGVSTYGVPDPYYLASLTYAATVTYVP